MGTKAWYIQESPNRDSRYVTPMNLFSLQCHEFDTYKSLPKVTHYKGTGDVCWVLTCTVERVWAYPRDLLKAGFSGSRRERVTSYNKAY
jgi:hypothetical protein